MSLQNLKNAKIYLGQYDVSGDFNNVSLQLDTEGLDATTFGSTAKVELPGLESVQFSGKVFSQVDDENPKIDDILKAKLALSNVPLSVSPLGGAAGDLAWTFKALLASYAPGLVIGQLPSADLSAKASGASLIRGTVLETGAKAAAGNGTPLQLGAVTASQRLYAALHILAISGGGTFTLKLQSDTAVGFPSSTDVLTFAAATAIGSEWKEAAGPITDDWWRASWTLTSGAVTFAVVVGIL
jgi:hypothetical protein